MDRKVFVEKVAAHIRKVLDNQDKKDFAFVVTMHFGEKVRGVISLGADYILVRLSGRYKGWKLALSNTGVNDGVGAISWSQFDTGAIYEEISAQQTLEGSVEILLTNMMEW